MPTARGGRARGRRGSPGASVVPGGPPWPVGTRGPVPRPGPPRCIAWPFGIESGRPCPRRSVDPRTRVRRGPLAIALAGLACATTPPRPPPVEELIRPDARLTAVRTGDLDGDGVVEVVAASVTPSEGVGLPHLELFSH